MIPRPTPARFAAAMLAGLLVLAAPTPAAAAIPPRIDEPHLVSVPCATGAIDYSSGAFSPGDRHLVLEGWIEPCTTPPRPAGFGVMRYYSTRAEPSFFRTIASLSHTFTYPTYPYDTANPRTGFFFDFTWTSGGDLRALCVARRVDAPIACVAVELPENEFARRFLPIPVDDPRITSVTYHPGPPPPPGVPDSHPACGNCV